MHHDLSRHAAQQKGADVRQAPRAHHDQIGLLLVRRPHDRLGRVPADDPAIHRAPDGSQRALRALQQSPADLLRHDPGPLHRAFRHAAHTLRQAQPGKIQHVHQEQGRSLGKGHALEHVHHPPRMLRPIQRTENVHAAPFNKRRTCASSTCRKSAYTWPTAMKYSGTSRTTSSSTSARTRSAVSGGETGTAPTSSVGFSSRRASAAASNVAPVARPSSTSRTVRPPSRGNGAPPRYRPTRRLISTSCSALRSSRYPGWKEFMPRPSSVLYSKP